MLNTIFAKKQGMSAQFTADGRRVGVTILTVPAMKVSGIRTLDKHGYTAIAINSQTANRRPQNQEVRINEADLSNFTVGQDINWTEIIQPGDRVRVTGTSKGKGWAGVVKRHNFKGGPRTHGQSDRERAPGSIGQTTTPGRVYRGKKMAGRMGGETVSVKNLSVLAVSPENNQITLIGSIPGAKTGTVSLTKI